MPCILPRSAPDLGLKTCSTNGDHTCSPLRYRWDVTSAHDCVSSAATCPILHATGADSKWIIWQAVPVPSTGSGRANRSATKQSKERRTGDSHMIDAMYAFATSARPFGDCFLSVHFWMRLANLSVTSLQLLFIWGSGPNQTPSNLKSPFV